MVETELTKKNTEKFDDVSGDAEHKSYKLYNFRRPDKFSKDNLRALRDIHRELLPELSEAHHNAICTGKCSFFSGPSKDSKPSVKEIGDVV